jgi:hypothetical protein
LNLLRQNYRQEQAVLFGRFVAWHASSARKKHAEAVGFCTASTFAMKGVARHDNLTDSAASNEMLARSTDLREIRVAAFKLLGMESLEHPRFDLVDAIEKPGVAAILLQAHGVTARVSNNMVITGRVESAPGSR